MQTVSASRTKSHIIKLFGFLVVLGLVVLVPISFYVWLVTLDLRGTFHNTADLADLDGDGDLDVILHNLRNESETVAFSQTTLWINQGGGQFSPRFLKFPPYLYLSAAAGDVDGDEDADLVVLAAHQLMLFLNQGGAQEGETGVFRRVPMRFNPPKNTGTPGSVVLGDLRVTTEHHR